MFLRWPLGCGWGGGGGGEGVRLASVVPALRRFSFFPAVPHGCVGCANTAGVLFFPRGSTWLEPNGDDAHHTRRQTLQHTKYCRNSIINVFLLSRFWVLSRCRSHPRSSSNRNKIIFHPRHDRGYRTYLLPAYDVACRLEAPQ